MNQLKRCHKLVRDKDHHGPDGEQHFIKGILLRLFSLYAHTEPRLTGFNSTTFAL